LGQKGSEMGQADLFKEDKYQERDVGYIDLGFVRQAKPGELGRVGGAIC
jgi:hypothetical protein